MHSSSNEQVGVGIVGDARKVFNDHNVSIEALQDLSRLANQKFGGKPKMWGLSSLTEKLTSKQVIFLSLILDNHIQVCRYTDKL